MDPVDRFNRLLGRFGHYEDGRNRFRITVTAGPHQMEKRKGTFQDWYGHIFIREYVGVRDQPKYLGLWNYDVEPHFVVEQLLFIPSDEIVNWRDGSWEPLYIFPWIEGKLVLPPWRAIELLMYSLFYGPKRTKSDFMAKDEEAYKREVELFETILENEGHAMHGGFAAGATTAMPKQLETESPLLRKEAM